MTRPRLPSIAIVAGVIAGLYVLDVFLQRTESMELHHEAQGLYEEGRRMLAQNHAEQALQSFQRAYTTERSNRRYQLAYAEALIETNRLDQASDVLGDAIDQTPNDGQANLLLARLARKRDDFADESAYYHRAIYGSWPKQSPTAVRAVRLEWIRALADRGDRSHLLGELVPLQAETSDPETLRQIAAYYLKAGSANRATALYRSLLETHPDDPDILKGLGEAETADGRYPAALAAYQRAFHLAPNDEAIRHDMLLTSQLSALDPTPRRLPSREKYVRSVRILQMMYESATTCGAPADDLQKTQSLLASGSHDTSNEAAEDVLQAAESLWKTRSPKCAVPEVLPLIMQKVTQ